MPDQTHPDQVVKSSNQPDYGAVSIPTKAPTAFNTEQRRAELLQLIEDRGHPSALNQTELADRYGVSQQQISKDLDRFAEYVQDRLGNRHELEIEAVFRRSLQGLLEEGEYRKAAKTAREYSEWMTERTDIQELREELEFLKEAHTETDT